jgi:secreted Zn-dependent insulinase-like peptidase
VDVNKQLISTQDYNQLLYLIGYTSKFSLNRLLANENYFTTIYARFSAFHKRKAIAGQELTNLYYRFYYSKSLYPLRATISLCLIIWQQ